MNKNIKKCPRCGHENSQTSIECKKCGIIFEKYKKRRDIEFNEILRSFHNNTLEDIKSKFDKIVNKYPDLSNNCKKFMLIAEQAIVALNSKHFDQSIKLFRDLKSKYPGFSEEADRHINYATTPMKEPGINPPQPIIQKSGKKLVNPIIVVSVVVALAISFVGYKFYQNIERRTANIEFSALVRAESGKMIKLAIISEDVVAEINKAWREAIFSEYRKRDFNYAIMEVREKRAADILSIESLSKEIGEDIKKMNPPEGKEKDCQRLKEIYLLFNKYADMAVTPSGSLQTYSQQNSEITVKIKSAIKELEMMR
jgi:hypothetical protein